MQKLEFISRQLSKTKRKKYENYVITRIWNLLNDLDLKIITQQHVVRPNGRAMTDLYFPQLKLHIEIDEGYHNYRAKEDKIREADIVNATGHDIRRISITESQDGQIKDRSIEDVNRQIDDLISEIIIKKHNIPNFKAWDINSESNPQTYIKAGKITIDDDCAFHLNSDAASCFGKLYNYRSIWKGGVTHPKEDNTIIWFPRLFPNEEWNNRISEDEETIWEKSNKPEEILNHIERHLRSNEKRIVFAKVKGPLGDIMYRFRGKYELDKEATNTEHGLVWRRTSREVKTYSYEDLAI